MHLAFPRLASIVAVTAAVASGALLFAPPSGAAVRQRPGTAPNHKIGRSSSSNWSGYDVTGAGTRACRPAGRNRP